MRLVRDPPFPCLISFICSAQMRVSRIHGMQMASVTHSASRSSSAGERTVPIRRHRALAETTEERLRDLGLGYRAPYVQRTAEMVAGGEADPEEAVG